MLPELASEETRTHVPSVIMPCVHAKRHLERQYGLVQILVNELVPRKRERVRAVRVQLLGTPKARQRLGTLLLQ